MAKRTKPDTRTCTRCRETFPATAAYFNRDRTARDGLCSRCKRCSNLPALTIRQRFERRVTRDEASGCHTFPELPGVRYGRFRHGGTPQLAHRVAWQLYRGPIPNGLMVCHTCDNTACVNPDHLWLGTQRDNLRDAVRKGRNYVPVLRGEDAASARLSNADASAIRQRYAIGETQTELAAAFNVSQSTVWRVVHRMTFKEQP